MQKRAIRARACVMVYITQDQYDWSICNVHAAYTGFHSIKVVLSFCLKELLKK